MRELASGAHAGSWLQSPAPGHHTPKWASSEWRLLLLWRLGSPLGLPVACVACGACQDAFGDHALSCPSLGMYKRHNVMRDTFVNLTSAAGLQCRTSVSLPGTNLVPADLFLPSFSDVPTAVDVSVVHPLHPSRSAHAAVTTGAAAEARAEEKVALYGQELVGCGRGDHRGLESGWPALHPASGPEAGAEHRGGAPRGGSRHLDGGGSRSGACGGAPAGAGSPGCVKGAERDHWLLPHSEFGGQRAAKSQMPGPPFGIAMVGLL